MKYFRNGRKLPWARLAFYIFVATLAVQGVTFSKYISNTSAQSTAQIAGFEPLQGLGFVDGRTPQADSGAVLAMDAADSDAEESYLIAYHNQSQVSVRYTLELQLGANGALDVMADGVSFHFAGKKLTAVQNGVYAAQSFVVAPGESGRFRFDIRVNSAYVNQTQANAEDSSRRVRVDVRAIRVYAEQVN